MSGLLGSHKRDLTFRLLNADEVLRAFELESSSYPQDEAASHEKLIFRQANAPSYFLGAFSSSSSPSLLAFVCGTRCDSLDHDSLSSHDPTAPILAIHSVCVAPTHRRQGIGQRLLLQYVSLITSRSSSDGLKEIRLICKSRLLRFYTSAGFSLLGPSAVVHGLDPWFDLSLDVASRRNAFWVVDAFATEAGAGNPAAVVLRVGDNDWMQLVAKEFNLSVTAFASRREGVGGAEAEYDLRYFLPNSEIPLCGHATLVRGRIT